MIIIRRLYILDKKATFLVAFFLNCKTFLTIVNNTHIVRKKIIKLIKTNIQSMKNRIQLVLTVSLCASYILSAQFPHQKRIIDTTERQYLTKLHYQPVEDGYQITGSNNIFNRGLYGGHANDHLTEKYVTFASDQPIFLGAITDWRKNAACVHAKCGTLMIGVASTPGVSAPVFWSPVARGERYSQWFHDNQGTVARYRNGWMEYELSTFAQCFPRITARIEVIPLNPEDGYFIHIEADTDQRVILVIGFGGITDFLGRFEFPYVTERYFSPNDCENNIITIGKNNARIIGAKGNTIETNMQIGTSFPVDIQIGNAKKIQYPGLFLERDTTAIDAPMVKMNCEIRPGKPLEGNIVLIRNSSQSALDKWLTNPDAAGQLKKEIENIKSAIKISTPDRLFDLSVPPSVLAMDASWHDKSFYHGTYAWHTPYMGWRLWYGPTVAGWHDRVKKSFKTYADLQVSASDKPEEVVYKGPGQYSMLKTAMDFFRR